MTITEIFLAIFGGIALGSIASIVLTKYVNSRLDVPKLVVEKEAKNIIDKFEVEKARMRYKSIKLEKEFIKAYKINEKQIFWNRRNQRNC